MLRLVIPGRGELELEHAVLDMNGTLAMDGVVLDGVAEALSELSSALGLVVVTADTHGTAAVLRDRLSLDVRLIEAGDEAAQKRALVEQLGPSRVVAIGNGANDAEMLAAAAVGIAVLGGECAARSAVQAADVVAPDILAALGLLRRPSRLVATLRV